MSQSPAPVPSARVEFSHTLTARLNALYAPSERLSFTLINNNLLTKHVFRNHLVNEPLYPIFTKIASEFIAGIELRYVMFNLTILSQGITYKNVVVSMKEQWEENVTLASLGVMDSDILVVSDITVDVEDGLEIGLGDTIIMNEAEVKAAKQRFKVMEHDEKLMKEYEANHTNNDSQADTIVGTDEEDFQAVFPAVFRSLASDQSGLNVDKSTDVDEDQEKNATEKPIKIDDSTESNGNNNTTSFDLPPGNQQQETQSPHVHSSQPLLYGNTVLHSFYETAQTEFPDSIQLVRDVAQSTQIQPPLQQLQRHLKKPTEHEKSLSHIDDSVVIKKERETVEYVPVASSFPVSEDVSMGTTYENATNDTKMTTHKTIPHDNALSTGEPYDASDVITEEHIVSTSEIVIAASPIALSPVRSPTQLPDSQLVEPSDSQIVENTQFTNRSMSPQRSTNKRPAEEAFTNKIIDVQPLKQFRKDSTPLQFNFISPGRSTPVFHYAVKPTETFHTAIDAYTHFIATRTKKKPKEHTFTCNRKSLTASDTPQSLNIQNPVNNILAGTHDKLVFKFVNRDGAIPEDQSHEPLFYRLNIDMTMKKAFKKFCDAKKLDRYIMEPWLKGEKIDLSKTLIDMGLKTTLDAGVVEVKLKPGKSPHDAKLIRGNGDEGAKSKRSKIKPS
ncbi:hypothetical protein BON22_0438 [Cyberlindnera fabianii]|uniref:Uncharacterized protein n=1 Tax=Cyberlindnera fabianii TaxID=36022 RepID=A0A1V2LFE1_CYBFA|nr:hypothetical protein BON22_0438 [Cyberlindnera fabianii]